MRTVHRSLASFSLLLAVVAACTVDPLTFDQLDDGGVDGGEVDTGVDAPPGQLVVSESALTVTEGATRTVTVSLSAPPLGPVLVNLASDDEVRVGLAPTALLFGTGDWMVAQTVTISGKQDADVTDDQVDVSLISAVAGTATVAVIVDDDDGLALQVAPSPVDLGEGATAMLSVRLTHQPASPVDVTVTSSDPARVTTGPGTLRFTETTWDVPQAVTLTGLDDADLAPDQATVTLSAPTATPAITAVSVTINIADRDVLGIDPSTTTLSATEGGTATFGIMLTQQPLASVTVTLTSSDLGAATASPGSLVFTTTNWNTPRTVMVTAVQDLDADPETPTLTLSAPSPVMSRTVSISVADDDTQAIVAAPLAVSPAEGGTAVVNVHLAYRPSSDVTVTASSLSPAVATVPAAQLVFTPSNYAADQPVTITALHDPDAVDGAATIRFEALALGLVRDVSVAVDDDDQLTIEVDTPTVNVVEGANGGFQVRLGAQPATPLIVAVTSADGAAAGASPAMLTFMPAAWDVSQAVTVSGVADVDVANENVAITLASAGLPLRMVTANVTDDDVQAIQLAPSALTVNEGATATVGVRLAFAPAADVNVTVTSGTPAVATAGPTTLTFTPDNYATEQQVTVVGVQDVDIASGSSVLTFASSPLPSVTATVNVTDEDLLLITSSAPSLSIGEAGSGTVNYRLSHQPAATVTVTIASSDMGAAMVAPTTLTFAPADYATLRQVTISGVADADASNESVTVTASAAGIASNMVSVMVLDAQVLGILTDVSSLTVTEGQTAGFGVRLNAVPTGSVTVAIVSSDIGAASASPATLTFTAANWDTLLPVAVTGTSDLDLAGEVVTFALTGSGVSSTSVSATVNDDDVQRIDATPGSLSLTEGQSTSVGISLGYIPSGNVVVTVVSSNGALVSASPGALTFTTANHAIAQGVTVTALQDVDVAGGTSTLTLTTPGAANGVIPVGVTDDDQQVLVVTPTSLTIGEAGSSNFTVRLAYQPSSSTTVSVSSADGAAVAVAPPTSFTFDSANWATARSVTVSGVNDADAASELVVVSVTSPPIPAQSVSVTVTDDDPLGIATEVASVSATEGGTASFRVRLTAAPAGTTTVAIATSDMGAALPSPASLTFDAANWSVYRDVTVNGVQDVDLADETVTLSLSASGLTGATVAAAIDDDDVQEVLASPASLDLTEGGSANVNVSLRWQPATSVTVAVSSNNPGVAVNPMVLTFTPANYATTQPVAVSALQDADAAPGSAALTLSTNGASSATVNVSVTDDDPLLIQTGATVVALGEGSSALLGVRLSAQPLATTTVSVSTSDAGAAVAAPATLTFTTMDWAISKTVTVSGVADADVANETVTITVSSPGLASVPVTAYVTDTTVQGIVTSLPSLSIAEGGSGTFQVRLLAEPSGSVTVALTSQDTGAVTASPASLTFTAANWNTDRDVIATGVADQDLADENTSIIASTAGAPDVPVGVAVDDDDVQQWVRSATASLWEGGSATVGLSLLYIPGGNVAVTLTSSDTATVGVSPATMAFTPGDYNVPKNVTFSNATVNTTTTATVTYTSPDVPSAGSTAVTVVDTTALISVTPNLQNSCEGQAAYLSVVLLAAPPSTVSLSVTCTNPTAVTCWSSPLVFTPTNWSTPQTFHVDGIVDADTATDSTLLTIGGAPLQGVPASVSFREIGTSGC